MKTEILHKPAFSELKVELAPGEEITAEAGALVYMSPEVKVRTTTRGGLLRGLMRKALASESIFVNTYYTENNTGYLVLAPSIPGDILEIDVDGSIYVADTCYLASTGLNFGTRFAGFKGVFTPGGMFWLELSGRGKAWLSSYGGIDVVELKPGERVLVDNIHLVAFDGNMTFTLQKFGGLKSFLLGGEYILTEFVGPGKIYIQSRNLPVFANVLYRFMPKK